ncbi:hypothetical protein [Dyella caseinilytica]|uniref:Uncharacterized protein n=1 Tax=Dyella caseinilytica TaxID=1849581 RepID=A0ABX7GUY3_9GAMM|nr:hypothetical protein [Dyella caseinilytica]QRN53821.1 hypothetical protein ISN74_20910 [Dyella caseinilytica]GFZ89430.1 hypothetical protein GCM10011408_05450 [Dyella caseinilytica]
MTSILATKHRLRALFTSVPLLIGATMPAVTPHLLPYTLLELARALPTPMPISRENVETFLHTPLRIHQSDEYMRLYDIANPLITRDGYIIKRVDVREAMPKSNYWRTDERKIFAMSLEFGATPCVPAERLREILDLPSAPSYVTGPEAGDIAVFGRDTAWGGYAIDVTNAHPDCATSMGVGAMHLPKPSP